MFGSCSGFVRFLFGARSIFGVMSKLPMTDDEFQHILDTLPPKSPRSRLEPYGSLIDKLRRRGRTYREIVDILATECGLRVSVSTLHDFIRSRSMQERKQKEREGADLSRRGGVIPTRTKPAEQGSLPADEIQGRISYLGDT
jgi:ppGpp synthetase/RelA/SpoT-type nucleotidyltranferase